MTMHIEWVDANHPLLGVNAIQLQQGEQPEGQRICVRIMTDDQVRIAGTREQVTRLLEKALEAVRTLPPLCPYTHAHTRAWCGNAGCRES